MRKEKSHEGAAWHVFRGGTFEVSTVGAMILRTVVWPATAAC